VSAGIFSTPRPEPSRIASTLAGGAVLALALPVFAIAGWPLSGWALAAVLWTAALAFSLLLARLSGDPANLAAASMRGIGTLSRAFLVGIPLVAVTASDERVGLSAAILYALAFTVELAVGLASYFAGEAQA
jgi:peptidoglycan/LPS O-acetylase OafA/YrhL